MLTGNVEVVVEASFVSTHYPHTLEARPSVLLDQVGGWGRACSPGNSKLGGVQAVRHWARLLICRMVRVFIPPPAHPSTSTCPLSLQANGSVYPSPADFTYKLALDEPNRSFNLSLCAAQARAGQWVAAVYNPLPTAALGFNLTVHKIGRCLHNCSDHGRWDACCCAAG